MKDVSRATDFTRPIKSGMDYYGIGNFPWEVSYSFPSTSRDRTDVKVGNISILNEPGTRYLWAGAPASAKPGVALGLTGRENESPVIPGMVMADMGAALHAAVGILLALISRERTNAGQFVDISYLDGAVSWLTLFADRYFRSGTTCRRGSVETAGTNHYYNIYLTKDGEYVSLGCIEPGFWENLCKALGREDLIAHQRAQSDKKAEIFAGLRQLFLTKTRDEWVDLLRDSRADIPCSPVNSFEEALRDPLVTHRMVREADCADKGGHKYLESAIKLSKTRARFVTPSPVRGQHTAEVLAGLGYSNEDIAHFSQTGVTE